MPVKSKGFLIRGTLRPISMGGSSGGLSKGPAASNLKVPVIHQPNRIPSSISVKRGNGRG